MENKTEIRQRLSKIKCFLLDMDGTVTFGEKLIEAARPFFNYVKENQEKAPDYIFFTNNSSHDKQHYVRRMEKLDILPGVEHILTSTDALILYMEKNFKQKIGLTGEAGRPLRIFPVGTPDFENDLKLAGLELVKVREERIDAVLVGFDTTLHYEKLDIACDYIRQGLPWLAANPDKVCPLENGKVLPDCGAITAFLQTCTDTDPLAVIGKPEPLMVEMVMDKFGYEREDLAMVGDRLYTDIACAQNAEILSIAVLSGETDFAEISGSAIKPDLVFDSIGDLAEFLP